MPREQQMLLPPHASELEDAILGAVMLSDKAMEEAMQILTPDMFYTNANKSIFDVAVKLYDRGKTIDITTVSEQLKKSQRFEECGGNARMSELIGKGIMVPHLTEHCLIVKQMWIARRLIDGFTQCVKEAYTEDVANVIEHSQALLDSLMTDDRSARHISVILKECSRDFSKRIENAMAGKTTGIPSGLADVDKLTGGWQNSNLVIIGGRPGSGKTAMMLHLAKTAAITGNPAAIFSLEMSDRGLVNRIILSEANIDSSAFRSGRVTDDDVRDVEKAHGILEKLPIYIDPTPCITIRQIKARAKALKRKGRCSIIFIDYLQLVDSPSDKNRNREQEVSEMSRAAKLMAKELDVPVVLLAQLSRKCEERTQKTPVLSDLRESGGIEQDADIVFFTFRPAYYGIQDVIVDNITHSTVGYGEFICAKNRDGAVGTARFRHNESLTKIYDFEYNGAKEPVSQRNIPYVNQNFEPSKDFDDVPF